MAARALFFNCYLQLQLCYFILQGGDLFSLGHVLLRKASSFVLPFRLGFGHVNLFAEKCLLEVPSCLLRSVKLMRAIHDDTKARCNCQSKGSHKSTMSCSLCLVSN
mmetsp:Transcript_27730/g.62867  ORF Transcript_27730/g.62867 Transcript_27730/m.62867 type:complete len:106 (+) Transcript_27730:1285-1602(+)